MPVIENAKFLILESMYNLGVNRICFDFKPDVILNELTLLVEENNKKDSKSESKNNKNYIINFYENKEAFIIDISGALKKEKIAPLKLMFINYLKNKLDKLRVIVYIFFNADEESMTFTNIWTLFKIWNEIGLNYEKVAYLTTSEIIEKKINKYFERFGVKHFKNLLEVIKEKYPEINNKDEAKLFEFSSQILQSSHKIS